MDLIIDTDPGIDDAFAIAYAAAHPDIRLHALTTVFGNTHVGQSSRNARYLLNRLGIEAAVAEGAAFPMGHDTHRPSAHVHGPEGLGGLTDIPEIGLNDGRRAAEYLIDASRRFEGSLVVAAIGPLTNIAEAVRIDPEFLHRLDRLVIMGGAFKVPGNITPRAEANIWHDAPAADIVFAAGGHRVMVGLDVTMKTRLSPTQLDNLATASPGMGGFLAEIAEFYLQFYRGFGITDGCPVHDATAIQAAIAPERFTFEVSGLSVPEADGDDKGATLAHDDRDDVHVAVDLDVAWAEDDLLSALATLP